MGVVIGPGGVGKSRVVGEVSAMESASCAGSGETPVFASGKFDQFTRRPFSALVNAVSQLVDTVLTQDASQLAAVRSRMLSSDNGLGQNAAVAIQLVSSISLITGPQSPAPSLGPTESSNRLHRVFIQLLRIFATSHSPLVLFIDDLQWADQPSLKLLQQLATDPTFKHCLIIGAYRSVHIVIIIINCLNYVGVLIIETTK
jgi:histidine kinase